MSLDVAIEDPVQENIVALLETHLDLMRSISPPESVHALDVERLREANVTFWTIRQNGELAGCGALKEIAPDHGEIKSMHVREAARGQGVARKLVETILETAQSKRYQRLSLETGSTQHFQPARNLYAAFGFQECGPFADYRSDPHSIFMTLELD